MKKTRNFLTVALLAGAMMAPLTAEAFWGFPFGNWDPWDNWGGPGYGYGYPGYGYGGYPGYGYGGYPGYGYGGYGYPGYGGYGYPAYGGYGYPGYAAPQPAAPAAESE